MWLFSAFFWLFWHFYYQIYTFRYKIWIFWPISIHKTLYFKKIFENELKGHFWPLCSDGHITGMPAAFYFAKSRQDLGLAGLTSSGGPDWTFATKKSCVILRIWDGRLDRSYIPQRYKFLIFYVFENLLVWWQKKSWANLM